MSRKCAQKRDYEAIVKRLDEGSYHGVRSQLARNLGLTRSAISAHVKARKKLTLIRLEKLMNARDEEYQRTGKVVKNGRGGMQVGAR